MGRQLEGIKSATQLRREVAYERASRYLPVRQLGWVGPLDHARKAERLALYRKAMQESFPSLDAPQAALMAMRNLWALAADSVRGPQTLGAQRAGRIRELAGHASTVIARWLNSDVAPQLDLVSSDPHQVVSEALAVLGERAALASFGMDDTIRELTDMVSTSSAVGATWTRSM